ncbi:MAG: 2-oxoacid:acceptor oxidoreductase subunit alpha [Gammaproteobacteria bacterium]|nr:2-oxoacid:acceptor oxidoreductase subunit alpha [Gammaproteobacteria bacterium]MXY90005.1 2-oxoacid:acceptor oxidoreductase subunit alpha [Gammaproteobacteria bacterium]MYE29223.1 2-oxoacid:acceptor oxidoreductase subunit alpha [Gammaproteobacteria bacterium]MYF01081.1 2-oxoacid:acceptor oxidoreductase subunit alpha [Gammaproteobacteria bacterium]MYG97040.1 2-oxoacid:acceptor oxidoreductase subunit alpha [Gammaproteobacteria bacterium]
MSKRKSAKTSKRLSGVNNFVVKFANVNGSGSASANNLFAKSIFRMGIPVSPHNIFPSNIQGLPTWYEVRVNDKGYLGRRDGVDLMVAVNEQTIVRDIESVLPGGYVLYDSSKALRPLRKDVNFLPIPLMEICLREFEHPGQRQLFQNIVYVGALAAFLSIDFEVLTNMVSQQFRGKEKLILPNVHALELGYHYANDNFDCPLPIRLKPSRKAKGKILMDGNTAIGLGCVYGGATVASWYPLTPSTSVVDAYGKFCKRMRIDPGTGKRKFSIVQAEDELAAIGIAIGASWNGARAFTASSGPGVSLMQEFLGLAYFAEVPVVLFNIQRVGPSTGMPTRTQQGDLLTCAFASHGDTRHILLFPSTPKECFEFAASSFDIADRLQTPVIVMSDLELGMNDHVCDPLEWDDARKYDRGKVLSAEALEEIEEYGRYADVDGDGIPWRTYPGAHPEKGSYFTRGSSHDAMAAYTEDGNVYAEVMDRLAKKFAGSLKYLPQPEIESEGNKRGMIYFGTTASAIPEVHDKLAKRGIMLDTMRIRSFPFHEEVTRFIDEHELVYVIEQNRDAQLKSLLKIECNATDEKMHSILSYSGVVTSADCIESAILEDLSEMSKLASA